MRKIKVSLEFAKLSVAFKVIFYRSVLLDLTGNALYLLPDVPLADAKLAVDNLEIAALAAEGGSFLSTAQLHEKVHIADGLFHNLAAYVERISNGNEAKIISSGFHCTRQPILFGKLPLAVKDGLVSGAVILVSKAIEHALSYDWYYVAGEPPATEEGWVFAGRTSRADTEILDLIPGTKYYFKMRAFTAKGNTDFCDPVSKIII